MAKKSQGRKPIPRNTDNPLENETPGVKSPQLQEDATSPQVAGYITTRGSSGLHPMPYSDNGFWCGWGTGQQWGNGWVDPRLMEQLLCDPKIAQATNLFVNAVMGRQMRSIPAVAPSDPRFEEAWAYADFCDYNRRMMSGSWYVQVRQLVYRGIRGHKMARIKTRVQETGQYKSKWVLDRLDVWPNFGYQFMRDRHGRFCSVRVLNNGTMHHEDRDPREFAIYSFRPVDDNPYGTNIYAPACEPFYKSVQANPELVALLTQYGRPGLYVIAPKLEAGVPVAEIPVYDETTGLRAKNSDGSDMSLSPLQYNATVTQNYAAGTVVNLAGGSLIGLLQATPGGDALFRYIKEDTDRDKVAVILGTDQLTESQRVVSSGNADSSEFVMSLGLLDARRALEEMDEIMMATLLELNYGPKALDLLPISDIGSMANPRLTSQVNAIGGLMNNGAFTQDQYYWWCASSPIPLYNPKSKPLIDPAASRGTGGNQNKTAESGGEENQ